MKNLVYIILLVIFTACSVEESPFDIIESLQLENQILKSALGKELDTSSITQIISDTVSVNNTNITIQNVYSPASFEYLDVSEFPSEGLLEKIDFDYSIIPNSTKVPDTYFNRDIKGNPDRKEGDIYMVSDRFGRESSAIYLNGYNCNTVVKEYSNHTSNNRFTLSFWIAKLGMSCQNSKIFEMECFGCHTNYNLYSDDVDLVENQWTSIILRFDGTSMNVYVNGDLVKSKNIGTTRTYQYFYFGRGEHKGGSFSGFFDEIIQWDRELNPKEIEYIATH